MKTEAIASPQSINAAFRPRVYPDVIVDRVEDEVILLHPVEARWALTNEQGLELARRFDGSSSLQELAERISGEYEAADPELVLSDLSRFARRLYETNLLENLPLREEKSADSVEPAPPDITIYTTEECNLRCKHCAIVEGKMPKPALTTDDVRELIRQHTDLHGEAQVSFIGGEPMLRSDYFELLEFARSRTPFVTLNTNGHLIDEETAGRLADLDVWVQISLDGADREVHDFLRGKGAFDKAWRAVEMLCEAGAAHNVLIANVLTRCMLPQIQQMIERVDALGIRTLRFLTLNKLKAAVTNWDRIAPDYEEMVRVYRYLLLDLPATDRQGKPEIEASFPGFVPNTDPTGAAWCPLGKTTIVDSLGNAYNCPTFRGPEYATGKAPAQSLGEIEEGEKNRQLRQMMLERRHVIPECRVCAWRNFCQGGCTAFTALRTGSLYVNDEFCDLRRDLYREYVKRASRGDFRNAPLKTTSC